VRKPNKNSTRVVTISLVLPVAVTVEVRADRDLSDPDVSFRVVAVLRAECDATPTMLRDHMKDDDYIELDRKALEAFKS